MHAVEARPRPAVGLPPAPRLQVTAAAAGLRLRDVTGAAGLPRTSTTWGAVIADFDADGADDIFLSRHGAAARLFLDRGPRFVNAGVSFGFVDRHGCAADDVDGSGLPDLYCSIGGRRGTGVKANELWLDPAGPGPALDPLAGRASEPLGRGRVAAFLDVDIDGRDDLFVGQETERMDGLPSDGRIYLRTGPARFRAIAGAGIDPGLAAWSISTGDIDSDDRTDLVFVHADPHSLRSVGGIRLYRNVGGRFRDVTGQQRVRSIGETDAELIDLDGDGRDDLIQLSSSRIRVSLKRAGGYRAVFERKLDAGAALAVADADGDGDQDIYVLRHKVRRRHDDVLLLMRGAPRRWRAVSVPSRHGGVADDVYAIDHDGNGRADFLALNGRGDGVGPVQLIASFPD
jgi:FG-GAP-like repeat